MIKALTRICVDWGLRCFGAAHMNNKNLRALRFLEEATELVQSCGVSQEKAAELIRTVYARPVGETYQEIGGTMLTLVVLCDMLGADLENAFEAEVRRCLSKDPAAFAKRNQEKLQLGLD